MKLNKKVRISNSEKVKARIKKGTNKSGEVNIKTQDLIIAFKKDLQ